RSSSYAGGTKANTPKLAPMKLSRRLGRLALQPIQGVLALLGVEHFAEDRGGGVGEDRRGDGRDFDILEVPANAELVEQFAGGAVEHLLDSARQFAGEVADDGD